MIHFKKGNILEANVEALVNTVNTVGIMGKGIALAFKKEFPENYKLYKKACDNNELKIGDLLVTQTGRTIPKYIINFPTKQHWRNTSKIEYIEKGMERLVEVIKEKDIQSIAIPPLGCGNGGLNWKNVKPVIVKGLESVKNSTEIILYEPGFNNQSNQTKKDIKLTPARAMLLSALNSYKILGYSINLLVAQKLAYFIQRLGEPLNLEYEKGYYGPYSHRLQHLLKHLNGYYMHFKHEKTTPGTTIKLDHLQEVEEYKNNKLTKKQKERLQSVNELIEGFESPYGLELLATVDYIHKQLGITDNDKITEEIGNWTNRKKDLMKPYHIEVANKRLNETLIHNM
jgi:O-acetyl-ADP-ribose deacetylase (regulator of RNase III)